MTDHGGLSQPLCLNPVSWQLSLCKLLSMRHNKEYSLILNFRCLPTLYSCPMNALGSQSKDRNWKTLKCLDNIIFAINTAPFPKGLCAKFLGESNVPVTSSVREDLFWWESSICPRVGYSPTSFSVGCNPWVQLLAKTCSIKSKS